MMNKSYRVVLSWIAWALPAVLVWFVAAVELLHFRGDLVHRAYSPGPELSIVNSSGYGFLLFTYLAPFVSFFCGRKALVKASALPQGLRIVFWMAMFLGVAAVVLLVEGQWERISANGFDLRVPSTLDFVLSDVASPALLVALITIVSWICLRRRSGDSGGLSVWMTLKDALAGAGCFLLVAALGLAAARYEIGARANRIAREADQRWTKIGRPMPEFAKGFSPVKENAALDSLVKALQPWGVKTLYKSEDNSGGGLDVPKEVMDVYSRDLPEGDLVKSLDPELPYLASKDKQFEQVYQSILAQDPPAWTFEPLVYPPRSQPSYLALRKLAQLVSVDALRRSSNGDKQGAACATYATLRVTEYLNNHPLIVSQMIRVAVEALMCKNIARLPDAGANWQGIGDKAKSARENLKRAMQYEALLPQQGVPGSVLPPLGGREPVPGWLEKLVEPSLYRLYTAKGSLAGADAVAILDQINPLTSADMGAAELTQVVEHDSGGEFVNCARAWLRLNFSLLLQEEAEVIRYARGRMQDGTIAEHTEFPSSVIPGATWRVIPDVAGNSIAVKLSPLPEWTKNSPVIGPKFFLLPLDGSKSWKFADQPRPGDGRSAGAN